MLTAAVAAMTFAAPVALSASQSVAAAAPTEVSASDTDRPTPRLTGSKTFSHTGSMGILNLPKGKAVDSNEIFFDVRGLPANATVTKISINTGASNAQTPQTGLIMGNNLQVESTTKAERLTIPWTGANNSVLENSTFYYNKTANGLYKMRWNGYALSGAQGTLFNPAGGPAVGRGYSKVKLTIYYTY